MKALASALLASAIYLSLAACSPEPPTTVSISRVGFLAVSPVSNLAHLISGNNALVEITSDATNPDSFVITVNDQPASAQIAEHAFADGVHHYRMLLTELQPGNNLVRVETGEAAAALSLVNYPITGPIFSGEQQQPYLCLHELAPGRDGEKRRFAIGNGEYLDDSNMDANCGVATRTDYVYRSTDTDAEFKPLPSLDSRPQDLAFTTTNENQNVPYIVRIETGTINRAIYQIAILHDPVANAPSALAPSPQWNGRLVYTFGGGCEAGYFQGASTGGVLRDSMLAKGYAVASSTLNVNAQGGCNDVLSAETTMMVKEHFIESYGEPDYTIGNGGSGGAMQQLLIAGSYPGILDGLLPSMTFPDAVSYLADSQECASLLRDFVNDPARNLDETTKNIIGGWSMWSTCEQSLGERPKRIAPDDCSAEIPATLQYHPQTNPNGIRCSIYDGMRNIFGEKLYTDVTTGREFARAPHDNVGVQYGLAALNEGLIDIDLFLDLNENIGGWNIDVQPQAQRTEADEDAIRIAYQTGRITNGSAGLSQVPIIDDRSYLDDIGNFHASVYSFVMRARMERDNGHANNYVVRRHNRDMDIADDNLALMDRWLAGIKADQSQISTLEKIVRARPADLQDDCFAANGERIVEQPSFDMSRLFDNTGSPCNGLFPPHAGLRLVAGGPLTNDILKCQLKEIDAADYAVKFTAAEQERLANIFPEGVCDWSKPGVQQQTNQTWLSYGPSPVNLYHARTEN